MAKKHSTSGNSTFSRIYRAEVALEIKETSERIQMYQLVKEGSAA